MKIFTDIFSGDKLLSDAYNCKLVDGVIYEADCAMVQVRQGGDFGISANASAEDVEDGVETVNNIVHSFRLQPTALDKVSFMSFMKDYHNAVVNKLVKSDPEQVEVFKKGYLAYLKKVTGSFDKWAFYTGESTDPDGMIVMLSYREDGTTPYVAVWKHGIKEVEI